MGTATQRLVPGAGASASAPGGSPAALAAPTAFAVAERWAQQDPQMHLELWVVTCITPVPMTCGTCAVDGTTPAPNDPTVAGRPVGAR